jgi:hypothetical protein
MFHYFLSSTFRPIIVENEICHYCVEGEQANSRAAILPHNPNMRIFAFEMRNMAASTTLMNHLSPCAIRLL